MIEECLILEIKAVQEVIPYFKAKIIGHLNMAKIPKGLLANFNVMNIMKEGLFVVINDYYEELDDE